MIVKLFSATTIGLEAVLVTIEIDIASQGLPNFILVGLADRSLTEAKERVRAAIRNSAAEFPARKITINMAPADLPKEGSTFDLAIALSVLLASGQIKADLTKTLLIGELSLDGLLRPVVGVLPLVLLAKKLQFERVIVPSLNAKEAGLVDDIKVFGCTSLTEVCQFVSGRLTLDPQPLTKVDPLSEYYEVDFEYIYGQEQAKRALVIAAAGGHNLLMTGPPGSGKSMLAKALPSILPPLTLPELLEVSQIYSISGQLPKDQQVISVRPFRSPHHTASYVGIVGGGVKIRPGEISLAHRGVLFLDEMAEFQRQILEALRQPLEDQKITLSRSTGSCTFPAQFILLGTQNPCPCGYFNSKKGECKCTAYQISQYQKKLSGPILDRIDLSFYVPEVDLEKMSVAISAERSVQIRNRVIEARQRQYQRFKGENILVNAQMNGQHLKKYCQLSQPVRQLLLQSANKLSLSARAYYRLIKVSRTIADLEGAEDISLEHLAEALQYR